MQHRPCRFSCCPSSLRSLLYIATIVISLFASQVIAPPGSLTATRNSRQQRQSGEGAGEVPAAQKRLTSSNEKTRARALKAADSDDSVFVDLKGVEIPKNSEGEISSNFFQQLESSGVFKKPSTKSVTIVGRNFDLESPRANPQLLIGKVPAGRGGDAEGSFWRFNPRNDNNYSRGQGMLVRVKKGTTRKQVLRELWDGGDLGDPAFSRIVVLVKGEDRALLEVSREGSLSTWAVDNGNKLVTDVLDSSEE